MNRAARGKRLGTAGLCLGALLLAAGCGGKGTVSGKVLYQGKPLRGGSVSFVPEVGGVMSSPIEEDGSYTIRNIPPGTVKITVETESIRAVANLQGNPRGGAPDFMRKKVLEKDPKTADPQQAKRYVRIPEQFSDPAKTKLSYVVKSGQQEHDIDLSSPPGG